MWRSERIVGAVAFESYPGTLAAPRSTKGSGGARRKMSPPPFEGGAPPSAANLKFLSNFGIGALVVRAVPLPIRPVLTPRPFRDLLRLRPEINSASGAELGLLPDHAGGRPLHVGNFRTAQAERIAHAGLLLFGGISPPARGHGPHRGGQDHCTE